MTIIPPLLQGQQLFQHQQILQQLQQLQHQQAIPIQGQLGQQGPLGQQGLAQRTDLHAITSITLQRDEVNNCYRCKVCVVQGCSQQQNNEMFVLYDGPFPITNEGIMEHLANFARERLVDEK